MAKLAMLIFFTVTVTVSYLRTSAASSENPMLTAAHSELTKYGFPIGILPTNVETYAINHTTGDFTVKLGSVCKVTLPPDNYLATYSKTITGKIVENRVSELNGIGVRAFFKRWGITGIRSNGPDLTFEVGMVTKTFPSKNFDDALDCGGHHSSS